MFLRVGVIIFGLATSLFSPTPAAASTFPFDALQQSAPALSKLYLSYPTHHKVFGEYASRQGFRRPIENLATVVHELVHVDSATHQGFFIDGIYYEPYLRRDAWPSLTNEQVRPYLSDQERRGPIYQLYSLNTPNNHLGNLIDEINAYSHVLTFVCRNEPDSAEKQVTNLTGFLRLVEGYLRTLRVGLPAEYQRFAAHKESRGAFTLIVQRSWSALQACGVRDIPMQEASYFIALPTR